MNTSPGSRLGPYEIVAPIGAGGMGEVFRARDTRLDRDVAVKVLPAELSQNAQLRLRFEREAKTISQLEHPNICRLYDVGDDYLVMELLEGESLADRIAKGPLPVAQLLKTGIEIATALERAHKAGIVHRDLKPGNVMLTKSGAKLLDFGLARAGAAALGRPAPEAGTATQATVQKPLTQEGTILGTFQYMAPEQLEGLEADARTDIFALGCVLYEMATGRRAFDGKTKTSLIAAIVGAEPKPISELQPLTPPALEHVILKCLNKDPDERWQSAHDIAAELRWISGAGSAAGAPVQVVRGRRSRALYAGLALVLAAAAAAAAFVALRVRRQLADARAVVQFSLRPPADSVFVPMSGMVSPDGKSVAAVALSGGEHRVWVRRFDERQGRLLAGTEGATSPLFWSPDSQSIGFFAAGKMKRISPQGGSPQTIAEAPLGRGAAWMPDGTIVFAPSSTGILQRVRATGGAVSEITAPDGAAAGITERWPAPLPGGNVLYTSREGAKRGIYALDLRTGSRKWLVDSQGAAAYAGGYLFFIRESTLFAQPFDPGALELRGDRVAVAEQVSIDASTGAAGYSVSERTLVFRTGGSGNFQLTWFDRGGKRLGTVGPLGSYDHPNLSPDMRYVAVDRAEGGGGRDLWLIDVARGSMLRATFHADNDWIPAWSPDSRSLVFVSDREKIAQIYLKPGLGSGLARKLVASESPLHHVDWSANGRWIAYERRATNLQDIWIADPSTGKARPAIQGPARDLLPRLSPDGRWLAYVSDENGQMQLYITDLEGSGAKWQVSSDGSGGARWRADGREIFWFSEGRMMAADVTAAETGLQLGPPRMLCAIGGAYNDHGFDVTRDGQKFLMPVLDPTTTASPLDVIINWPTMFEEGRR